MARASKKTATTKSTPARRGGRPSNASIAERNASAQRNFIEMVGAAASAAARGAVEAAIGSGTVSTLGIPQNSGNSGDGQSASGTSRRGGSTSASNGSTSTGKVKQAPGRRPDPNSKLSKSAEIYAANVGKMERNDIVNLMVKKLDISKSVANTYYHTIHRKAGGTSTRRTPAKKALAA